MRLARVFFDVHMSLSHDGLREIVTAQPKLMQKGEVAIFINKSWTRLKLYDPVNDCILYLNRPRGIVPGAIKYLPTFMEGNELRYDKALEAALKEEHAKTQKPRRIPLREPSQYRNA